LSPPVSIRFLYSLPANFLRNAQFALRETTTPATITATGQHNSSTFVRLSRIPLGFHAMKSTTCSVAIPSAPNHPSDSAAPRLQAAPASSHRAHNCRKNAVAPIVYRNRPAFCFRAIRASISATIVASTAAIPCGQPQTKSSGAA